MSDLCKHHELILQYAEDAQKYAEPWKLWEVSGDGRVWLGFATHPNWDALLQYRRKPRTIRIGEYDVPEPIRVEPEPGQRVYFVDFYSDRLWYDTDYDGAYDPDRRLFKNGLLHTTPEAAELHGRALASLTEGK